MNATFYYIFEMYILPHYKTKQKFNHENFQIIKASNLEEFKIEIFLFKR